MPEDLCNLFREIQSLQNIGLSLPSIYNVTNSERKSGGGGRSTSPLNFFFFVCEAKFLPICKQKTDTYIGDLGGGRVQMGAMNPGKSYKICRVSLIFWSISSMTEAQVPLPPLLICYFILFLLVCSLCQNKNDQEICRSVFGSKLLKK